MSSFPRPLLAFLLVAAALAPTALAQSTLRIGVVVPGSATGSGSSWSEMLAARAWERDIAARPTGIDVELLFRDGGTTRENTLDAVRTLLEDDLVHAVVCCVTAASADAAALAAFDAPLIALARPVDAEGGLLTLAPGPRAIAGAIALDARRFGRGVGLMTVDDDRGKAIADAMVSALIEAGLPLARAVEYPAGSTVLTPEGLLVAASEPSAVVVWGTPEDALPALDGLRERGYEGPVYLPWEIARELPGGVRNGRLRGVLVAAPPAALGDRLPADHPTAARLRRFEDVLQRAYGAYEPTPEGALAFDALGLLMAAAELAIVYGVDPGSVVSFRQALRDALVALEPREGAAGSYDWNGLDSDLALPEGIVIATPVGGALRPAGDR